MIYVEWKQTYDDVSVVNDEISALISVECKKCKNKTLVNNNMSHENKKVPCSHFSEIHFFLGYDAEKNN